MKDSVEQFLHVHRTVLKNSVFSAILKRSRRLGYLEISIDCCDDWNQPNETDPNWTAPDGPRENGRYDVEGRSSLDINGFYRLNLFNPKDLWSYFRAIGGWIKDSYELRSWSFFIDACPLFFPWSQWTWTLTSFKDCRYEVAEEVAEKIIELRKQKPGDHTPLSERMELEEQVLSTVTNSDVEDWLRRAGDSRLITNPYIWVSTSDPTNFCVNDSLVPFDKKDGWSEWAIKNILSDWFEAIGFEQPIIRISEKGAYSALMARIKYSLHGFLRNNKKEVDNE